MTPEIVANSPTVADWMQGWGAVLSLPLALGALIFSGWLLRHEIRTRREERDFADSALARLVLLRGITIDDDDGNGLRYDYHVHNYGDRPVLDVGIWTMSADGERYEPPSSRNTDPLEAGADRVIVVTRPYALQLKNTVWITEPDFLLVYTDAEGYRWYRRNGNRSPMKWLREPTPYPSTLRVLLAAYLRLPEFGGWISKVIGAPGRRVRGVLRERLHERRERRREGIKTAIQQIEALHRQRPDPPQETDDNNEAD